MKRLLSAPFLLVIMTSATLFTGPCTLAAYAEEPSMPQTGSPPMNQPPVKDAETMLSVALQNPAQAQENTVIKLEPGATLQVQPNTTTPTYPTLNAVLTWDSAMQQKRLKDAQAAVQATRARLAQAASKSNALRSLSQAKQAAMQAEIQQLQQQLAQNLGKLKSLQTAQAARQATIKQWQSASIFVTPAQTAPNTPYLKLPQGRNLLYTPADAAILIKRNLLLTPEDRAKDKIMPLHK